MSNDGNSPEISPEQERAIQEVVRSLDHIAPFAGSLAAMAADNCKRMLEANEAVIASVSFCSANLKFDYLGGATKTLAESMNLSKYTAALVSHWKEDNERMTKMVADLVTPSKAATAAIEAAVSRADGWSKALRGSLCDVSHYQSILGSIDSIGPAQEAIERALSMVDLPAIKMPDGAGMRALEFATMAAETAFLKETLGYAMDDTTMKDGLARLVDLKESMGFGMDKAPDWLRRGLDTLNGPPILDDPRFGESLLPIPTEKVSTQLPLADTKGLEKALAKGFQNIVPTLFQDAAWAGVDGGSCTLEMSAVAGQTNVGGQSLIFQAHMTLNIAQLTIERERPHVPVPEEGCIALDMRLSLCCKDEEKRYGLHYFLGGRWNYMELQRLQALILQFLYHRRGYEEQFAQRLDQMAEILSEKKSARSIWNQIDKLLKLCEEKRILPLIKPYGNDRWYLNRDLSCCDGMFGV